MTWPDTGVNVQVMQPGQPNGRYHSEPVQEDFLVLYGECIAIVEDEERSLRQWDFLHCPAGSEHIFVGAGDGPCAVLMIGSRHEDECHYTVNDKAAKFRWDRTTRALEKQWLFMDRAITWTLSPMCSPNHAVYLNTLESGDWRIIGLDWDTGEHVAEIRLGSTYKYNCAGGFIWPLPSGDLFVGGMFGPVLIRRG